MTVPMSAPDPIDSSDKPIVELHEVRKSFGALEVLKGISFSVRSGEVVCIIGPS
ncbi:MAG TPA: peptide ABC transporter ATP-binding protein, partial [Enterovirga sp.]